MSIQNMAIEKYMPSCGVKTSTSMKKELKDCGASLGFYPLFLRRTSAEKALRIARPEYFNTDQGSQFTSHAFLNLLQKWEIKISMDGRGRCIDNVYQERGWWSLKYEKIYLHRYEAVRDLLLGVDEYIDHFNHTRPHQALLYATPNEIYHGIVPKYSKGKYTGFEVKNAKRKYSA